MLLTHNSHLGCIKSAPDTIYYEGEIKSYWEVKEKLPPMIENRQGRVIYFVLNGWYEWPYGTPYHLELPDKQPCFAGFACLKHERTTLKKAESTCLDLDLPEYLKWLNLDKMEVIIPIEWIPKELLPPIIYEY